MQFKLEKRGKDEAVVKLTGALDESTAVVLADVGRAAAGVKRLVFDVSGVARIASLGIKDWMGAFKTLEAAHECSYEGCTMAFVDTALMVPAFVGSRPVRSILALFSCDSCNNEETRLVTIEGRKPQFPENGIVCKRCGEQMLAGDGLEADLEAFLARQ